MKDRINPKPANPNSIPALYYHRLYLFFFIILFFF